MKIPNIKLGFSNKRYTHNLSRDCNTTFPFGIVQPILTQYLLPNSDIRVNAKQLVRLAPMPVPSLAFLLGRGCGDFVFYAQGERICKGYIVTKSRAHGRSAHARAKLKDVR